MDRSSDRAPRRLAPRYIGGVTEALNRSYEKATPGKQRLAQQYLKGYQKQMAAAAQAAMQTHMAFSMPQRMPMMGMGPMAAPTPNGKPDQASSRVRGLLRRQGARLSQALNRVKGNVGQRYQSVTTPESAFEIGIQDAARALRPHTRLKTILR